MDDLLEQFIIEGRDLVAQAHAALVALGHHAKDRAAFDSLFRAIHTLKGSVALFDMAPAHEILHAVETRMERARQHAAPLDAAALDALLAVVDQTDRWIDAMQHSAALDPDAAVRATRLIDLLGLLGDEADDSGLSLANGPSEQPDWLTQLRARPRFAAINGDRARTAFRYTPDPDCFFRGEDPLAIAASVPDVVDLALLPATGQWPDIAACEPFACMAMIEGVSGADEAAVRAAFRLVPDQILLASYSAGGAAFAADDRPEEATTMLRVEAARLDRLADQSGELSVAIRALRPIAERLRALDPAIAAQLSAVDDEITRVAAEVQRSLAQVRLVPIEPVLRRLPRLARDAAATLGKAIRFTLEGETARVDKQLADQLFEPLLHLVRNAVDHGIEPHEERLALGKPAKGQVHLSVRQDGGNIEIMLTDDGRGIDPVALRASAIAKGLISSEAAAALDDAGALRIILLPGFSTAASASSLSGRGVGMDAVHATISRLAGTISIESQPGKGTQIMLRLPAHAITTPLLVVGAGDQHLGIRLDQIAETTRINATAIQPVGQAQACVLRDTTVPVLDLAALLDLEPSRGMFARLVVTDVGQCRTALRVASFGERFDAVVRETKGILSTMPSIAGTAMMADGGVLLVLDLPELLA